MQITKIKETAAEWGKISPRLRDAVIEGASEKVIEKYRKLTDDYTKAVSTEATGLRPRTAEDYRWRLRAWADRPSHGARGVGAKTRRSRRTRW